MEEQPDKKKEWTEKPFKIENNDLRNKGIVDRKYRLIGINGKKLRIKRNNFSGVIKVVRKKNWQPEYKNFFDSLDDPWKKIYNFRGATGKCTTEKIKICESNGKICNVNTNRCINPKKAKKTRKIKRTKRTKQYHRSVQKS